MGATERKDITEDARKFIEKIERINQKYGMGGDTQSEDHDDLVREIAQLYWWSTRGSDPTPAPSKGSGGHQDVPRDGVPPDRGEVETSKQRPAR